MFSEIHYSIRSKTDGKYLAAHPQTSDRESDPGYLLLFRENFEALSYLNAHAAGLSDRFFIESISGSQLKNLLQRWGFKGVGIVLDPLLPRVEFFSSSRW